MNTLMTSKRARYILAAIAVAAVIALAMLPEFLMERREEAFEGHAKIRDSGQVSQEVINSSAYAPVGFRRWPRPTITSQVAQIPRQQWEPRLRRPPGSRYVLYPQYGGVPVAPTVTARP
jgi:hypothetical protein